MKVNKRCSTRSVIPFSSPWLPPLSCLATPTISAYMAFQSPYQVRVLFPIFPFVLARFFLSFAMHYINVFCYICNGKQEWYVLAPSGASHAKLSSSLIKFPFSSSYQIPNFNFDLSISISSPFKTGISSNKHPVPVLRSAPEHHLRQRPVFPSALLPDFPIPLTGDTAL